MCCSKEGRGFPALQCSPSSLPAPSAFSRNISVCRVPLSTSFLILCRERKHRDGSGKQLQGPNHNWKCKLWDGQGKEHQAAPNHGIQSRESPWDVPEFLPVAAGRALQAAAQISGHLWLDRDMGMQEFQHPEQNKLSQGIKPNWFAEEGRMGSTEEMEEPRVLPLTQD